MNPPVTGRAPIGAAAAIEAIRRRSSIRVHGETPALRLLGIEDKFAARVQWREQVGKPVVDSELSTLDGVRNDIARRSKNELQNARDEFRRRNKIATYFPDEGPFRRELYPKHMEVIRYTKEDDEILFMAANKVGKTDLGGYCVARWAMGRYPDWWPGRVFDGPITAWVVNKTAKDTRDINEAVLLGPPGNDADRGTGMLPAHLIQRCTPKPGTPHAFEFINVEHVSGGTSYIVSKSYDQGREAFQGRNLPVCWNDEEVPKDIYDEEMLRIMVCGGLILSTFTPIHGLTDMTTWFMEAAGFSLDALRHSQENADDVE